MCVFIFHIAAHREEHVRNLNFFLPLKLIILFIYLFIHSYPPQDKRLLCAVKQASLIRSKSCSSFRIHVTKRQAAQNTAFEKSSTCTFCVLCFHRDGAVHK